MKNRRQDKILELIDQYDIETQDNLIERLQAAGFAATQATISRDIRELKLMKISENGEKQRYVVFQNKDNGLSDKYIRVLRDGFVSMDMAQNLLVIKTVSGMAMAVGAALDALKWSEIVGCIAGDDTVMCAIRTVDDTLLTMDKINKVLQ